MDFPLFDLNNLPLSQYSDDINSLGLDDFLSDGASFFRSDNINVTANEELDEGINIPVINSEGGALQLETRVSKKELSDTDRLVAYQFLLERMVNGALKIGATKEVAGIYGVGIRSIQRLWQRVRESGNHDHHKHRVTNCGRKRIEFDLDRMRDILLWKRTTVKSLSIALGVSTHFEYKRLREGVIRRHTNVLKPTLTIDNLISRMKHCISNIDPSSLPHQPTFNKIQNTIHIDGKWFYLSKKSQRYYLLQAETDPVRTIKNSNFIPKVMFLAAVARPRYDSNGFCTFDGKIEVFPLVESLHAIRSSHNRPRGTIEIKPINNITRDLIRQFMICKVLPTISNKWPKDISIKRIFIQQDNAKTHIYHDDVEFLCAVEANGLNVSLIYQPPNSSDLNVLDLGFFRAIQSLQSKECAKSNVELIAAVEDAYNNFSVKKSNYIFLTLWTCMIGVLKCGGSNVYKIPHIKKRALERLGSIPSAIQCPMDVYATTLTLLSP